jgi:hypothetical protein
VNQLRYFRSEFVVPHILQDPVYRHENFMNIQMKKLMTIIKEKSRIRIKASWFPRTTCYKHMSVGFKILTEVAMKCIAFCDKTLCSPFKTSRNFG